MTMMNLYDLAREYADVYGSGVSAAELIESAWRGIAC